jgi:hypothetical protein
MDDNKNSELELIRQTLKDVMGQRYRCCPPMRGGWASERTRSSPPPPPN